MMKGTKRSFSSILMEAIVIGIMNLAIIMALSKVGTGLPHLTEDKDPRSNPKSSEKKCQLSPSQITLCVH